MTQEATIDLYEIYDLDEHFCMSKFDGKWAGLED